MGRRDGGRAGGGGGERGGGGGLCTSFSCRRERTAPPTSPRFGSAKQRFSLLETAPNDSEAAP